MSSEQAIIERNIRTFSGDLSKNIKNFKRISRKIEIYLQSQFILAFQKQGRGTKWESRMTPNIPGIIRDLSSGQNIKKRRFDPRPALMDTGRLKNSGATRTVGNKIYWGSNLPYSGLHQWGGKSEIESKIPDKLNEPIIKRNLKMLEKKGHKAIVTMLSKKRKWTFKVHARPFLELLDDDYEAIKEIIKEEVI
jgi:phage gpG-like protein